MPRITYKAQEYQEYDAPYRKVTRIDAELGNWPYEPGGHATIKAYGTQRAKPRKDAPIWEVMTDDSDDPHISGWKSVAYYVTYTKAKEIATLTVIEQTARRSKQDASSAHNRHP